MTRVVLDTNVLISGWSVYEDSERVPARVVRQWRENRYLLLTSDKLRAEFARTFRKPYFQARFNSKQIRRAERLLASRAQVVAIDVEVVDVASHPEDDAVLASAISGRADFLVTGDRQLQRLGTYRGIAIVSPRDFLTLLEQLEQDDEVVP